MAQPAAEPGLSAVVQSIKVSGPLRAPSSCSRPTRVARPAQPCLPCSAGFLSPHPGPWLSQPAGQHHRQLHAWAGCGCQLPGEQEGEWGLGQVGAQAIPVGMMVLVLTSWLCLQNRSPVHHFLLPASATPSSEPRPPCRSPGHGLLLSRDTGLFSWLQTLLLGIHASACLLPEAPPPSPALCLPTCEHHAFPSFMASASHCSICLNALPPPSALAPQPLGLG